MNKSLHQNTFSERSIKPLDYSALLSQDGQLKLIEAFSFEPLIKIYKSDVV